MPNDSIDPRRFDRAFQLVARFVRAEPEVPIAALAVATSDATVRAEAFAAPDASSADTGTAFPIASLTKPIVATAVMQLVEAGDLVLSTPIREYLPDFDPLPAGAGGPGGEAITTWHVLTHTSGLADVPMEDILELAPTADDHRRLLRERPLTFAPGSAYAYCTDSFYLLGELLERLTGLPYPDALRERLFGPLGMAHTGFDPDRLDCPNAGLLWTVPPVADLDLAQAGFVSLALPGGGLWSTLDDLVAFGQVMVRRGELDGRRVLGSAFVDLMTREQTTGIVETPVQPGGLPRPPHYGLGWDRPTLDGALPGSLRAFGHSGATGSRLWIDPEADLVVVYLMNRWGARDAWWRRIVSAVYGALG